MGVVVVRVGVLSSGEVLVVVVVRGNEGGIFFSYVWKSATVALSPSGRAMNSWPAPLIMVRGTRVSDEDTFFCARGIFSWVDFFFLHM